MKILDFAHQFEKLALNTPAFNGNAPDHMMDDRELARAIRLDMESELDAINLYGNHLHATKNKEAADILEHVIKEEKEHLRLFEDLLEKLDPSQDRINEEPESQL